VVVTAKRLNREASPSTRIAFLTTHPIQYHAPVFRALAERPQVNLEVLYCHDATASEQAAAGFGVEFTWDVDLLNGYSHRFLKNVANRPTVGRFNGLDTPEVSSLISRGSFDAVVVNGWHFRSAWQAMLACWRSRTPVLMRSDSHLKSGRSMFKKALKRPLYQTFIPKLDGCLPTGKWSRDYFLHYGAKAERVFVVPHAIDTEYFSSRAGVLHSQREELRARWNITPRDFTFLFAGKFVEKKRPMDFVQAICRAAAREASVKGLMVGDGPLRSECEAAARSVNGPITFAGFLNQSEMAQAYVAADALILPSDGDETWGLVVNEAMSCGLPCIVSDHVGCGPDLIVPGLTGDIFPLYDVNKLTELIVDYASRRTDVEQMRTNVRETTRHFSVEATVNGLLDAVAAVKKTSFA
jgi:glycosyltransferase involved in cell wall biosynthesis